LRSLPPETILRQPGPPYRERSAWLARIAELSAEITPFPQQPDRMFRQRAFIESAARPSVTHSKAAGFGTP